MDFLVLIVPDWVDALRTVRKQRERFVDFFDCA